MSERFTLEQAKQFKKDCASIGMEEVYNGIKGAIKGGYQDYLHNTSSLTHEQVLYIIERLTEDGYVARKKSIQVSINDYESVIEIRGW